MPWIVEIECRPERKDRGEDAGHWQYSLAHVVDMEGWQDVNGDIWMCF